MISFEALLLAVVLSIDLFAVSFAYGSSKIKIPFKSIMIITAIGSVILGVSVYLGAFLMPFMPGEVASVISFTILFALGVIKIFDSIIKRHIRKRNKASRKLEFSIFSLKFILNIYADPEKADVDKSRIISPKEAVAVAIAVAIDAFALGFGAGLVDVNHLQLIGFSLVIDVAAVVAGCFIGGKIAQKSPVSLSWLGGVILILLAFF
ncbi:MAG: sporulation membrane protein YtaF [Defluviitaleaceae bacterium]|nr:sporulation membrane protein YtaF [Defluviitaleaceae bacterium]